MRQSVVSYNPFGSIYSGYSSKNDWLGEFMRNGGGASYYAMPGDWGSVIAGSGYYLYDMLHNTRLVITSTGSSSQSMTYSAFGPEVYNSYATSPSPIRQFQGEMGYDRDLPNLNYARNRFVDTTKGRWISRDPIGFDGGDWNRYRFDRNNPVNASDPTGLWDISVIGKKSYTCAEARFAINWTGFAKTDNGWLVQHITTSEHVEWCNNTDVPNPINVEYWEAWQVINGVVYAGKSTQGAEDLFDDVDQQPYPSHGHFNVMGHAKFLQNWSPPSGWGYGRVVPYANSLMSGWHLKDWSDTGAKPHSMRHSWNCCCAHPKPDQVITVPDS